MNPNLQTALTEFVNRATQLLDSGTAQLPAVLNDIVAYALFDAWFAVFVGVGGLTLAALFTVLAFASDDDYNDKPLLFTIGAFISGITGIIFTFGGAYHVYYVTHFPRLVILDYLKELL